MNDYNIKQLYEEMEIELITSMKRNLNRHLKEETKVGFQFTQWQAEKLKELKRYQRENRKIIGGYTKGLNEVISKQLQKELKQGSINAIKQFNKYHTDDKLKPSELMNKSFFQTNDRKVNSLIKVVNNDLNKANSAALRMINDEYRQVIHKSAFFVGNGVYTEKQAIDMATKDFLSRGLNCIEYADGRRINIASYAEMAVRTTSLRTHLMGEGDFRKSIGRTLVKVTSHGGACKLCTAWQGKILVDDVYSGGKSDGQHQLLSEAMNQGFLHPNCRHGLTTYYPELEDISYDTDEEELISDDLSDKYNYYERQEKKYTRLEKGSLFDDNIDYYRTKRLQYIEQQKLISMINDTRNVTSSEFQARTKGVTIGMSQENYSRFSPSENKIYLGTKSNFYDLIHELGHKLQSTFTKEEEKVYNKIIKRKFSKYTKNDFEVKTTKTGKYWLLKDSSDFVSKYQTRIYNGNRNFIFNKVNTNYALEYFSEGIKYYYENKKLLLEKDKELYEFIKGVVEK